MKRPDSRTRKGGPRGPFTRRQVVGLAAVLDVAASRRDLPVRVEPDAVGRVEIVALHLALQALALGEARHRLQAVAEYHAFDPCWPCWWNSARCSNVVPLKSANGSGGQPRRRGSWPAPFQVVDDRLGMDLFLDVEGRILKTRSVQSWRSLARQTSCASERVSAPVSASSFICSTVIF